MFSIIRGVYYRGYLLLLVPLKGPVYYRGYLLTRGGDRGTVGTVCTVPIIIEDKKKKKKEKRKKEIK